MAVFKICFTYETIAITIIPWLEAVVAIIDETMSRPVLELVKFDFISISIFMNMLNYSWW